MISGAIENSMIYYLSIKMKYTYTSLNMDLQTLFNEPT